MRRVGSRAAADHQALPSNVRFLRYRSKGGRINRKRTGAVARSNPCGVRRREMREVPGSTAHEEIWRSVLSFSRAGTCRSPVLAHALAFAESIRFCPAARRAGIPLAHL